MSYILDPQQQSDAPGILAGLFGGAPQAPQAPVQMAQAAPQPIAGPQTLWDRFQYNFAPEDYARRVGMQAMQQTYHALAQKTGDPTLAALMIMNPGAAEALTPKWEKTGQNEWGQDTYGFVSPLTRQVSGPQGGAPAPTFGTSQSLGNDQVTGDKFLETVPPSMRTLVKKVAGYEIDPTKLNYRGAIKDRIIASAAQYDPTYDMAQYPARAQAIKEFNTGGPNSPAGQITAGNTAILHADELLNLSKKVGGTNNAGLLNYPANLANEHLKGLAQDKSLASYDALSSKFVEELTKFYRGTGGAESDITRDLGHISAANSPEAREAALKTLIKSAKDKVDGLQNRWVNATGPTGWKSALGQAPDSFKTYSDRAQKVIDRINEEDKASQQSQPQGYAPGTIIKHKGTGERRVLNPQGQWVPVQGSM